MLEEGSLFDSSFPRKDRLSSSSIKLSRIDTAAPSAAVINEAVDVDDEDDVGGGGTVVTISGTETDSGKIEGGGGRGGADGRVCGGGGLLLRRRVCLVK